MRDLMKTITKVGVCEEKYMPYKKAPKNDKVKLEPPPRGTLSRMYGSARRFRSMGYIRLKTVDEVCQSLYFNGPCLIGIGWRKNWGGKHETSSYPWLQVNEGVEVGFHSVVVCGYNKSSELFKVRNSWGTDWGKGGYVMLTFAAFEKHVFDCWATFDIKSPIKTS